MAVPDSVASVLSVEISVPLLLVSWKVTFGVSVPTTNEPPAPLPPESVTLVSARPGSCVCASTSCTAETGASPGASAGWQVEHCASSLCVGCVLRKQVPDGTSQVAKSPK